MSIVNHFLPSFTWFLTLKDIMNKYSLFSRASGRYFSLQIIPLPRADAIVSYGVRSAVIMRGSTSHDLIATRDKIRSTTVERDYKKAPKFGVFYYFFSLLEDSVFEVSYVKLSLLFSALSFNSMWVFFAKVNIRVMSQIPGVCIFFSLLA